MTTPLLGPYIAPFKPVANITPFTYKDGLTYLEILEGLRKYVNTVIVPFVNDNFEELGDEFENEVNRLFTVVDEKLAEQNATVEAQLAANLQAVNDAIATVDGVVDSVNAALAAQTAANDAALAAQDAELAAALTAQDTELNTAITTLTAYVDAQVDLMMSDAVEVQDEVVATLIEDPLSDTHIALVEIVEGGTLSDSVIADLIATEGSATNNALDSYTDTQVAALVTDTDSDTHDAVVALIDPTVAALIADTDSPTSNAVDARVAAFDFDTKVNELIVDDDSATRIILDATYMPIVVHGYTVLKFADWTALWAFVGTAVAGDVALVDTIPGAIFTHNGTAWVMKGVPEFADATARNEAIPSPVLGMKTSLDTERFIRRYDDDGAFKPYGSSYYPVIPTSVSGTTVTVDDDGLISFTAAPNISVSGCFNDDFRHYRMRGEIITPAGVISLRMRLRALGSDLTGATDYGYQFSNDTGTSHSTQNAGAVGFMRISPDLAANDGAIIDVTAYGPNISGKTRFVVEGDNVQSATAIFQSRISGIYTPSTQADGFTIYPSTAANLSGYLTIEGFNKNS